MGGDSGGARQRRRWRRWEGAVSGGRRCRRCCGRGGLHLVEEVEVDCSRPGARSQLTAMTVALRLLRNSLARNRTFVSTPLRRAETPAILRRSPTVDDIQTAELDVEPLALGDAQLTLTERAAQVCRDFNSRGQQF